MRDAGVEPDVEDVGLLLEGRVAAAVGIRPEEVLGGARVPRISAFGANNCHHVVEELLLLGGGVFPGVDLPALPVGHGVEERDRRAPAALPRDDPLAPALDHSRDALLPPCGDPPHPADRLESALTDVESLV